MLESISTRRASAKARKVQRPSRLTVVMRANTDAHEPVASMRYPEKYTMRTPAQEHTYTHTVIIVVTKMAHTSFHVVAEFSFPQRKCHSPLYIPHRITNCHPLFSALFIRHKLNHAPLMKYALHTGAVMTDRRNTSSEV